MQLSPINQALFKGSKVELCSGWAILGLMESARLAPGTVKWGAYLIFEHISGVWTWNLTQEGEGGKGRSFTNTRGQCLLFYCTNIACSRSVTFQPHQFQNMWNFLCILLLALQWRRIKVSNEDTVRWCFVTILLHLHLSVLRAYNLFFEHFHQGFSELIRTQVYISQSCIRLLLVFAFIRYAYDTVRLESSGHAFPISARVHTGDSQDVCVWSTSWICPSLLLNHVSARKDIRLFVAGCETR